jgi:undecaprenyl-diphosphatase
MPRRVLATIPSASLGALQAAVLGTVQGLTEFVPVSSSAHLVIVPFLLGWPVPDLAFDAAVHLGTALAVAVYFAADLAGVLASGTRVALGRARDGDRERARLIPLLAVGTVPAAVAGLLGERLFEELFTSSEDVERIGAPIVGLFLLGTAALLFLGEAVLARRDGRGRGVERLRYRDAVLIGLFQAAAIAPGISRSGATIVAGLFLGLRREASARFSFLLSLPAILGAAIVSLPEVPAGADLGPMLAGGATAAAAGFAAIAFLLRYLRTRTMRPFAVYCVLASAVTLVTWMIRT